SEKEVFLRELISNASDACDKLRYLALTTAGLISEGHEFAVTITTDAKAGTLTISDNGIGMNREDLIEHLGTIARSGTASFVEKLAGEEKADKAATEKTEKDAVSLIGQFGVGFYSAFMVADRVDVVSRKAGEDTAWHWSSDGLGEFTIKPAEKREPGTAILLHLGKQSKNFLEPDELRRIVKTYSDHISLPIRLVTVKDGEASEPETLNEASALWARPKSEITDEQYKECYHHVAHAFDEPWLTLHYKAEGKIEYDVLLFVPTSRPFDLFDPARANHVKLYVRRVFITDDCKELLPPYLRFLRGVIDSADLALNISREMLQNNPLLSTIRNGVTKKVLAELQKKAKKEPEDYAKFWQTFGAVLKEGLYEDFERRTELLSLTRVQSTKVDGLTSFEDYVSRMPEGQKEIYYITGEDAESLKRSPHLEGFKARGIEVLLLTDAVDDFWLSTVTEFDGKPFRSVTRGAPDFSGIETSDEDKEKAEDKSETPSDAAVATLTAAFKQTLGDAVKDVRTTDRLTESPVCLVADDGDLDVHLQRLLKGHDRLGSVRPKILEINPRHALIRSLAEQAQQQGGVDKIADHIQLLFDQARIVEGEPLTDPAAFAKRMAAMMRKSFGAK
ncbi:MAG TPA: molecular chaperone HtpG, partial [Alphaproteobacteria bacterium]|nr:molecular chaperone HtpG [Alphaproteobacteria bacterium]